MCPGGQGSRLWLTPKVANLVRGLGCDQAEQAFSDSAGDSKGTAAVSKMTWNGSLLLGLRLYPGK